MFLAAACVNYYGPFTQEYRDRLLKQWHKEFRLRGATVKPGADLCEVLGEPSTIRNWNLASLPFDPTSITNAIIITNSIRVPLIYDPQLQATNWIRNFQSHCHLKVIKETEKTFWKVLEEAVQSGWPVLVRDVKQSVNPLLDKLLLVGNAPTQGSASLYIGPHTITVSPHFRLYLISTVKNPNFPLETYNKVNVVNFQISREALEEQLLAEVVRLEAPKLESVNAKLLKNITEAKNELEELEDALLKNLAKEQGNILDDATIISELERAKAILDHMNKRIEHSEHNKLDNEKARNRYRPIAERASVLYLAVNALSTINWMYQFSINEFMDVYSRAIKSTYSEEEGQERQLKILENITKSIFSYVSVGLFNSDKVIFSFLLSVYILISRGQITREE